MEIGIIGVGHIGKTLALKLAEAGHKVVVANSSGPENIDKATLATGAKAVTAKEAVENKEVIILSIPLNRIPEIAPLLESVSEEVTVIDTSNYYPARDHKIDSIESGLVESEWVAKQLGRTISKAWNAIGAPSFESKGKPSGALDRFAIPFSADRDNDRKIITQLIEETGFDAYYTGSIADSWRQQPGAPIYCTDLTAKEMKDLIYTAERERLPARRDLAFEAVYERMNNSKSNQDPEFRVRINRALYI